jgi:precorrin-6A/cobalt-precorrin-6A reductase
MRVLLLGGTTEASKLAELLADDPRFCATLSLAGVTQAPVLPRIAHRIGGFGGANGLSRWMRAQGIAALIDATHPYAVQMSRHAVLAAAEEGIPLLRINRPAWMPQDGDRWVMVRDAAEAAGALGDLPRRVLLTLGSKGVAAFCGAPAHHYVVRCIDAPDPSLLPPRSELLLARGPFTLGAELALLAERRIDVLVSKNSGGTATAPKLEAARRLGLPVLMIERPAAEDDASSAVTAEDAMRWLLALHQGRLRKVMVRNAPIQEPAAAKQT